MQKIIARTKACSFVSLIKEDRDTLYAKNFA